MRHIPFARGGRLVVGVIGCRKREQGVVLFIALIVLVAMTLAAVALTRSIDATILAAGNLAFRKGALSSTDIGVQAAMSQFSTNQPLFFTNATEADSAGYGYCSTIQPTDNRGIPLQFLSTPAAQTTCAGVSPVSTVNSTTNETVRYLIERMCVATGQFSQANCTFAAPPVTHSVSSGDRHVAGNSAALFRVTVRVDGAKNTVSYSQVIFRP